MTATKERPLSAVPFKNALHTPTEQDIRRIHELGLQDLSDEDLRFLKRIRDCRASLQEAENEKEELKERIKARKEALEDAIANACRWAENRQLAMNFGGV